MLNLICSLLILYGQFIAQISGSVDDAKLPFKFKILTANADDSFTLPIYEGGTYNFTVNWGDGSSSQVTSWDDTDKTHTYDDNGASTYEISISGTLKGWSFGNYGDKVLVKEIMQWGIFNPSNMGGAFYGCANLTISATDKIDLTDVTTLEAMFKGCTSLTTESNLNDWDVSNIIYFKDMFSGCTSFNGDLSDWNTSSAEDMSNMFRDCQAFNQDISGWDTADVTTFAHMFYNAQIFNQNISGWDTGKVTTMQSMFATAYSFEQNLGSWSVGSCTTMTGMFNGVTLNTSNYDGILNGWANQSVKYNVSFHAGNSKYSVNASASRALLQSRGWTINDGGQA